jgi:hypothetical protein
VAPRCAQSVEAKAIRAIDVLLSALTLPTVAFVYKNRKSEQTSSDGERDLGRKSARGKDLRLAEKVMAFGAEWHGQSGIPGQRSVPLVPEAEPGYSPATYLDHLR